MSAGVRVRIDEADLPLALRIIENTDMFQADDKSSASVHPILVPVDFNDHTILATQVAIGLALRHNCDIVFLHSYLNPYLTDNLGLSNALTFDLHSEIDAKRLAEEAAQKRLAAFAERLRDQMMRGELPKVKFSTVVAEGVPEDAISEYARNNPPYLVVMGTRGAKRKIAEMVGSVTSEVIDKCDHSVLTIPGPYDVDRNFAPRNILFFANRDQEDILAIDTLARIFVDVPDPDARMTVTLINLPGKRRPFERDATQSLQALAGYCTKSYPEIDFKIRKISTDNPAEDLENIEREHNVDLIVVPNKRKNAIARLLNPGLAQRILISADLPMLVIRV